ncbi:MAG TPA: YcbK family protein [Vicinamibacterales bacterium]|nr:YcbK family protein [Vicinamibacterales bacterium]
MVRQDGLSRRRFLMMTAAATTVAVMPARAFAGPRAGSPTERVLSFFNTHTGERLTTAYCCGGEYQPEALQAIDHILRDFRANEVRAIDPALLDLLHELGGALRAGEPFHVISGYRSPRTNAQLRSRGGAQSGVASGSLHMIGKAIDIRMPGVQLHHLRQAAVALRRGGVGYYPVSDFVHVDTGRVRYW